MCVRFQSLTGRLKTAYQQGGIPIEREFQSLTGRLKTTPCAEVEPDNLGFNPSQVG